MFGNQKNTTETKKEIPHQDIYNDYICFSCELIVKTDENGNFIQYPTLPINWQDMTATEYDEKKNGFAIITGKQSNITVIEYESREIFDKDKLLHRELVNHYVLDNKTNKIYSYFKYNEGMQSTTNAINGIDIKNDGKYVFAPPTKYIDDTDTKYLWVRFDDLKPMTNELHEYLINTYIKPQAQITKKTRKTKKY